MTKHGEAKPMHHFVEDNARYTFVFANGADSTDDNLPSHTARCIAGISTLSGPTPEHRQPMKGSMIMTDTINNDAATNGNRKPSPFLMPGDVDYPDICQEAKPIHRVVAYVILDMERYADWRRKKAEEYPEDEARNLDCAAELDEMAKRLSEYEGGPALDEYEAIYGDANGGYKLGKLQREEARSICFTASDPEEFFRDLVERYNARIA